MYVTAQAVFSLLLLRPQFAQCPLSPQKVEQELKQFFLRWKNSFQCSLPSLWIVLAKFGWPLFEGMLEKRENTIKTNLEKAEEARQESERLLAEYQEQLEDAKSLTQNMLNNAQKSGEALEKEIADRARAEADAMIEKAKVAIEAEKRAAMKELQDSMADTSIAVASRLIGEDFSDEEHRKLIERYVKEAGSLNA